jgi:molybdopterin-containing oxidoreductase family iron-sulfur binding subunit
VESCTARARRFGDISNPKSEVSKLLKKYENFVLKPEEGTKPNVYYIRKYSVKA